jgi:hypothetical protein
MGASDINTIVRMEGGFCMAQFRKPSITSVVREYRALTEELKLIQDKDEEPPRTVFDAIYKLAGQLSALPATSEQELADKAEVVLDWVDGDHLPSEISASLCRDVLELVAAKKLADLASGEQNLA